MSVTLAVDADTAFAYLVRLNQNSHRKLRDVAAAVVKAAQGRTRQRIRADISPDAG